VNSNGQKPKRKPKQPEAYSDAFEKFWEAFPRGRRKSKGDAWKAWKRAIKLAEPELLISVASEYAGSPVASTRFVQGPSPWLNQRCWEDDREAWNRDEGDGVKPRPRTENFSIEDYIG
jgi:hypothetical protein